jgi:hypothetical protein
MADKELEKYIKEVIEPIREKYRFDLGFSKYLLDDATENQSDRFDYWNQKYVDAMAYLEAEQRELSEIKTKLEGRLRLAIADEDIVIKEDEFECYKSTEGAITSAVEGHKDAKAQKFEIAKSKVLSNTYKGAVEAFSQRKSMIKECSRLAVMSYFGDIHFIRKQREEVKKEIAKTTKVPKKKKGPRSRR